MTSTVCEIGAPKKGKEMEGRLLAVQTSFNHDILSIDKWKGAKNSKKWVNVI